MRRPGGPFRFFRCSIEAMIWLNPIWMNREVVFIGGRRCHHMPTLVVNENFTFFSFSLTTPADSIRWGYFLLGLAPKFSVVSYKILGPLPYGFRVEKGDIFLPSDVIVVKGRQ